VQVVDVMEVEEVVDVLEVVEPTEAVPVIVVDVMVVVDVPHSIPRWSPPSSPCPPPYWFGLTSREPLVVEVPFAFVDVDGLDDAAWVPWDGWFAPWPLTCDWIRSTLAPAMSTSTRTDATASLCCIAIAHYLAGKISDDFQELGKRV
jgi:hypothetical protein